MLKCLTQQFFGTGFIYSDEARENFRVYTDIDVYKRVVYDVLRIGVFFNGSVALRIKIGIVIKLLTSVSNVKF